MFRQRSSFFIPFSYHLCTVSAYNLDLRHPCRGQTWESGDIAWLPSLSANLWLYKVRNYAKLEEKLQQEVSKDNQHNNTDDPHHDRASRATCRRQIYRLAIVCHNRPRAYCWVGCGNSVTVIDSDATCAYRRRNRCPR